MLTVAERNSLLLSLGFLLVGAGIKAWKRWHVEIGPFDPATASAGPPDKALTGAAPAAVPAGSAPGDSARRNSRAEVPVDTPKTAAADTFPSAAPAEAHSLSTAPADRKPSRGGKAKLPKAAPACPVDANSAAEDRLANLPGVGPRTAAAIAAYRKVHGPFRNLRELLQVKGIGEKKLALIAPCLILSGAGAEQPREQAGMDPERVGEGSKRVGTAGP